MKTETARRPFYAGLPTGMQVTRLTNAYNRATNPTIARTDREHRSCRRIARVALAMLRRNFREGLDWKENENSGRLWPVSR